MIRFIQYWLALSRASYYAKQLLPALPQRFSARTLNSAVAFLKNGFTSYRVQASYIQIIGTTFYFYCYRFFVFLSFIFSIYENILKKIQKNYKIIKNHKKNLNCFVKYKNASCYCNSVFKLPSQYFYFLYELFSLVFLQKLYVCDPQPFPMLPAMNCSNN